ncbi:MAG: antA/AntB antirepressor family protein [Helicobacteraceae bacterium]|jgi:phage anti-repressor protein|nr:antA/AntB antirepressor family protein [Helicobacteraceae bacterium]
MTAITISQAALNGFNQPAINARELHAGLDVLKPFAAWIKNQITRANLIEGADFSPMHLEVQRSKNGKFVGENPDFLLYQKVQQNRDPRGGHNALNYLLTLDAAKHITMMSQSRKAKAIRQYFIEIEKKYRAEQMQVQAEPLDLVAHITALTEKGEHYDRLLKGYRELHERYCNLRALVLKTAGALREFEQAERWLNENKKKGD